MGRGASSARKDKIIKNPQKTKVTTNTKKGDPTKWGAHNISGQRLLETGETIAKTMQGKPSEGGIASSKVKSSSKKTTELNYDDYKNTDPTKQTDTNLFA